MTLRSSLALALCAGFLTITACGEAPVPAPTPAPAPALAAPELPPEPPPEPPAPVFEAAPLVDAALASPEALAKHLATAASLDTWLAANPNHADALQTRVVSARLRLNAIGAAAGLGTDAATAAVGGDGALTRNATAVLASLAPLTADPAAPASDAINRLHLAAQAILAADSDEKSIKVALPEAQALAEGDTVEGAILRAVWLSRLDRALAALADDSAETRIANASRQAGRILCPTCDGAFHITPDGVTRFLLNPKNKGTLLCDAAVKGPIPADPKGQIDQLSWCKELAATGNSERVLVWGANLLGTQMLTKAHALAKAPVADGPLKAALKKRSAAILARTQIPLILPVAAISRPLEAPGTERTLNLPAPIGALKTSGLTVDADPISVVIVGPEAVRFGMRPIVTMKNDALISISGEGDFPAGGRESLSLAEVMAAPLNKETGDVDMLSSETTQLLAAVKALGPDIKTRAASVLMVVDANAPGPVVARTLTSMESRGVRSVRFARLDSNDGGSPFLVRSAPETLTARLNIGYAQPVIAVAEKGHIDIWAPANPADPAPKGAEKAPKLPEGAEAGYRRKDLVRLRVAIPETLPNGLDSATTEQVVAAVAYFRDLTGAGPLVHVISGKSGRAADVLRVAQAVQRSEGTALTEVETIWPGASCPKGRTPANAKGGSGCPTTVAVAFSAMSPPSSRGVRNSAATKKPTAATPKPPAPSAGFCDKNDIKVAMRKRASAFRFCYQRELQSRNDTGYQGRVGIRFRIGSSGSVSGEPKVTSATLKDSKLHACLIKNIKKVKFKQPDGGSCVVNWPFKFSSN